MRALLPLLACVVWVGALHAADKSQEPIAITLGWRVSLDAQGHLVSLQAIPNKRVDRVPEIRARLEQEIRSWQFLPGMVNGKPEPTDSGLYVRATLIPISSNAVRIHIVGADTGASSEKVAPPRYPPEAISRRVVGEVVLRVGYDADGNVTSAALDPDAPKANPLLVKASIDAARKWKLHPESVGGHSIAGYSVVPFCYSLRFPYGGGISGKCDWKPPGSNEALHDGEPLALNPAAKLLTDVAGRTL